MLDAGPLIDYEIRYWAGVATFCKVKNLDKVEYVMQVGKHFDWWDEEE